MVSNIKQVIGEPRLLRVGWSGWHLANTTQQLYPLPVPALLFNTSLHQPTPPCAESHTLRTSNKPPDALHTEAVVAAVKAARRAILLTGTPSLSRPFDLFRQVGHGSSQCKDTLRHARPAVFWLPN